MLAAASLQPSMLDVPTLAFVAVCIATLLGFSLSLPGYSSGMRGRLPGGARPI